MHRPLRRPMHGGDFLTHNHRQQLRFEAGGFLNQGALVVKHKECRKTRNLDSPSDILETLPSDTPHQKACCERQVVSPLSMVLFAPILLEKLVHRQYLHGRDHEPVNTNSYISSVLVE